MEASSNTNLCSKCQNCYSTYFTLLEHLYWRHGDDSNSCPACPVKWWHYALHKCFLVPRYHKKKRSKPKNAKIYNLDATEESVSKDKVAYDKEAVKLNQSENNLPHKPEIDVGDKQMRESKYCTCGKNIDGADMIGCDGRKCPYQWYHFECVGIVKVPEGDWKCDICRNQR